MKCDYMKSNVSKSNDPNWFVMWLRATLRKLADKWYATSSIMRFLISSAITVVLAILLVTCIDLLITYPAYMFLAVMLCGVIWLITQAGIFVYNAIDALLEDFHDRDR